MSGPKDPVPGEQAELPEFSDPGMEIIWKKLCKAAHEKNFALALDAITRACRFWKGEHGRPPTFKTLGDALRFLEVTFRKYKMKLWISSKPADIAGVQRQQGIVHVVCRDSYTGEEKPLAMYVTANEEEAMAAPMPHEELLRLFDQTGVYVVL